MIARFFRAEQLDRIERSLGAALALLENLSRKVATMAHEQDDLTAAVAKLTTAVSDRRRRDQGGDRENPRRGQRS